MKQIIYKTDGNNCCTIPCPFDMRNEWGAIKVHSGACAACRFNFGDVPGINAVSCNFHQPSSPHSVMITGADNCRRALHAITDYMDSGKRVQR